MALQLPQEQSEVLQQRFAELPPELQTILTDGSVQSLIETLRQQYAFSDEQATTTENEIVFVLMGLEPLSKMQNNISNEAGISPANSMQIVESIYGALSEDVIETLRAIESELGNSPVEEALSPEKSDTSINPTKTTPAADVENVTTPSPTPPPQTTPQHIAPTTVPQQPLSGTRTMQGDIASVQHETHNTDEGANIPRYAKPLTEMPRYNSGEEQK